MTAATLTAPLDVLKTRLQSDIYQSQIREALAASGKQASRGPFRAALYHLGDTVGILGGVYRNEGARALFKGLGPNLVGVIPARSINFYVYGNGKRLLAQYWNGGEETAWVHLASGVAAGVATSTATNPIWMIKTRLQLDKNLSAGRGAARRYRNSVDCVRQIVQGEGIRGLYKGMSASYLGVVESTMQWMLYEQLKKQLAAREERIALSGREKGAWDKTVDWTGNFFAAGGAKLIAAVIAYPHEVSTSIFLVVFQFSPHVVILFFLFSILPLLHCIGTDKAPWQRSPARDCDKRPPMAEHPSTLASRNASSWSGRRRVLWASTEA